MSETKIFLDTEFTGLRQDTTLISLALVAEDERSLYLEFNNYDRTQVDDWIFTNVIANLFLLKREDLANPDIEYASLIKRSFDDKFVSHIEKNTYETGVSYKNLIEGWLRRFGQVQIISDCPAYDWVLFCGLWGNALRLPEFISPVCHDINQDLAKVYMVSDREGFNLIRENIAFDSPDREADKFRDRTGIKSPKHNALWDAIVIKKCWGKLNTGTRH